MFLYGFYFGGTAEKSPSLLETFVFPIPFDFHSVVIVSIIFLIGILLLIILTYETLQFIKIFKIPSNLKENRGNGLKKIGFATTVFLIYHIGLSIVFLNEIGEPKKIPLFLGVWIGPFILALFVAWALGFRKKILLTILELFSSLIVVVIISAFLKYILEMSGKSTLLLNYSELFNRLNLENIYIIYLVALVFSLILRECRNFFFSMNELGFIYRLITFSCFSFLIVFFLDVVYGSYLNNTIWTIYFLALLCSLFAAALFPLLFLFLDIKPTNKNKVIKDEKKNKYRIIMVLLMWVVLAAVTLINFSIQSFEAGKYLRKTIIKTNGYNENKNYLVETIIYSDKNDCLNGYIVTADKNGVYYISNEDWKLITLKNLSIRTQPIQSNESNPLICEKK